MDSLHQGIVVVGIFSFLIMIFMAVTTAITLDRMRRQLLCKDINPRSIVAKEIDYAEGRKIDCYHTQTKSNVALLIGYDKKMGYQ